MNRLVEITSPKLALLVAALITLFLIGVGFRASSLPFSPSSEFSDAAISRYPDALYFQRSLRDYQTLPLWNPHLMAGQPFAANPGTKVWYPLTWLLLVWSPTLHINAMIGFHLWLAAMGMWVWARRTGMQAGAAALAALAYGLSPKLIAHAGVGHLDLLIAAAWLPLLLAGLHGLLTEAITPSAILLVAWAGAMIFIGALQVVPIFYGVSAAYAGWLLWRKQTQRRRALIALGAAAWLGAALSAVQWLPLIGLRDAVSRGDIRLEDAALFSLKAGRLLGLLIGDHGSHPETLTYVGVSVFWLAVLGTILRPRQNGLWWGVVIFAALYALGGYFVLWRGLVALFPSLLLFRVPSRAWFLVALLLPYLAGWGMQALLEKPPEGARARLGAVGFVGLGATCAVSSLFFLGEALETAALIGLFALPLTGLLIALAIFRRLNAPYLVGLFLLLVLADGLWIDRSLIEGRPRSAWLDESPPAPLVGMTGRLYTPDYAIPQQNTAYWRLPRFDGVDPFQLEAFVDSAEAATGVPREGYSTTVPAVVVLEDDPSSLKYKNAPLNAQLLGQWGVEWVVAGYPIEAEGLNLAAHLDGLYFYKNQYYWGEAVHLEWASPNRLQQTIAADAPETISAVANAAGWKTEDSKPVAADAVSLPARSGTFIYRPMEVYVGLAISLAAYLFCGAWWVWSVRRGR